MLHELGYHKESCFITLTYSDDNLPFSSSLRKRHLQLYLKRLRKNIGNRRIKYFAVGEYGEISERPHYHAIIFGLGLRDADIIRSAWNYADWSVRSIRDKSVGLAEPDSIRYVAQYIDKKLSGGEAHEQYNCRGREPVFRLISNGIGSSYCRDTGEQIRTNGYITVNGVKSSVPRYYINKLELDTEQLKERAKYVDAEEVEKHTGLCITSKDLLAGLCDPVLIDRYYRGILAERKAIKRNLEARANLRTNKKL